MRAEALTLSVLLAAAAATLRADDIASLSGTWKLVVITYGRDQTFAPEYVLTVRQEGAAVTMEGVIAGGRSRLSRVREFTIGARKATTGPDGIQTKGRVENQTLILDETAPGRCGVAKLFPDTGLQERRSNGDGSASRRSELRYSPQPICTNASRRSVYRVSGDGTTLEVTRPGERWLFKRQ